MPAQSPELFDHKLQLFSLVLLAAFYRVQGLQVFDFTEGWVAATLLQENIADCRERLVKSRQLVITDLQRLYQQIDFVYFLYRDYLVDPEDKEALAFIVQTCNILLRLLEVWQMLSIEEIIRDHFSVVLYQHLDPPGTG